LVDWNEEPLVLSMVDMESRGLGTEPLEGLETELPLEAKDSLSVRLGKPVASGGATLTTLTPWPDMPLAGMKRVVLPSFLFRWVRSGWKSEQQSFASLEVEYQ
jgi:hypothetical protein